MKIRRGLGLLALAWMTMPVAWGACPEGTTEKVGPAGEAVCWNAEFIQTRASAAPAGGECPAGSFAWTNARGEPICESFDGTEAGHVNAEQCPQGSSPTVDAFGNRGCKLI